jgi:hypothetical protein
MSIRGAIYGILHNSAQKVNKIDAMLFNYFE